MKPILVTGGTGTLGKQLVSQLTYQGFDVGVLTTRPELDLPVGAKVYHGNLVNGAGLDHAVPHQGIVVHAASNPRDPEAVDINGTKNLVAVAANKAVSHFVYVSIAGVDTSDYPYYRAKQTVERLVHGSGVPWTVLRATQFHDMVLRRFIEPFDRHDGSPLEIPSGMRFQSVDVGDVANRLQQLAVGPPRQTTLALGGPEVLSIEAMTHTYLRVHGRQEKIQPLALKSDLYDVFRSGVNIDPSWEKGKITWEEFLKLTG